MSKTKAGGSTKLGRDSKSKRLGVKVFGSQSVKAGNIILRQRGSKYVAGENTILSKDHTILAKKDGHVEFTSKKRVNFSGRHIRRTIVNVVE